MNEMRQTPTCYASPLLQSIIIWISIHHQVNMTKLNILAYPISSENAALGFETFDFQSFLAKSAGFQGGLRHLK